MENTNQKVENIKKPSTVENIGKVSLQIGEKLGKAVTEWFTGKPLTEEEKELRRIRKERAKTLKLVQEEAQYQKDLELAIKGEYVPPVQPKQAKKKNEIGDIFSNLGKHNPLEDFNRTQSIGKKSFGVESFGGVKQIKPEDLELKGFEQNPLGQKRRR